MRVLLDATAITHRPSGARTRLLSLYPRVARMEGVALTVMARADAGLADLFREAGADVKEVASGPAPWKRGMKRLNRFARRADRPKRFDLFAAETLPLPRMRRVPMAATLHDLRFMKPGLAGLARRLFATLLAQRNLQRAAALITVSESIAQEIRVAFPGLDWDRVHVVQNGPPSLSEMDGARGSELLRGLCVEPPYFLCMGHLEPRKNLELLIEAFHTFRHGRAEAMAFSLVLAGAPNPGYDRVLQQLFAGLEGRPDAPGLHLLGPVSEEARTALLKSALLVVQPAKYEGFGMGVLEAMTVGIPLACSKIPAHEEVAGIGGALYFSRDSVADAAKALTQGALDYRLRGELVMQGKARAAEFSWDTAAEHLKVIWNNLVSRNPLIL